MFNFDIKAGGLTRLATNLKKEVQKVIPALLEEYEERAQGKAQQRGGRSSGLPGHPNAFVIERFGGHWFERRGASRLPIDKIEGGRASMALPSGMPRIRQASQVARDSATSSLREALQGSVKQANAGRSGRGGGRTTSGGTGGRSSSAGGRSASGRSASDSGRSASGRSASGRSASASQSAQAKGPRRGAGPDLSARKQAQRLKPKGPVAVKLGKKQKKQRDIFDRWGDRDGD